ncbi:hypothetical protein [Paenibacillus sp. IHBB 10380]|uniref:hypothetical protein n=1 Tax=Paenibacillus sp. IHBB 10380 TaxID=1566358 RepID=UPI0005CFBDBF|nr:hypothetical protein [Paenibacillus sp. IHBB 10380]AJS60000.1 hypothetical protein UB51_17705 [Paenibacillus sp. IHBB 10380]
MGIKTKKCLKCKEMLPTTEFNQEKKNKDGLYSYCKKCRTNYTREWRLKKFEDDPYLYLLKESCIKAFGRGQPNYHKSGYSGILCEYPSVDVFVKTLQNDPTINSDWIAQTDIFLVTKDMSDRPTLDRIDSNGNYVLKNLKVSPFGVNSYTANVKPVQICILEGTGIKEHNFPSVADAKKLVKTMFNVPASTLKHLDSGSIVTLGNGLKLLVQSQNGDVKDTESPKYRVVVNTRYVKYDLETDEEVDSKLGYQIEYVSSGIRLNKLLK